MNGVCTRYMTIFSRPLLHEAVKSNNSVLVKNILDSCLAAVDDEDSFGKFIFESLF